MTKKLNSCGNKCSIAWCLCNDNNGRLEEGDRVKMRGDMGGFILTIEKIHNEVYCTARGYNKLRHINMNCLEKIND